MFESWTMIFFGEDVYKKYPIIKWSIRILMIALGIYCLIDATKTPQ